jgi:thiosulfate reductase cytochrome b subunit
MERPTPMRRVYIYKRFERFWHWSQALLVLLLVVTGLDIHFRQVELFGFEQAVSLHNYCAGAFVVLVAFAVFWHVTTGEWRQYIPIRKYVSAMVMFYAIGIFRNEPHPVHKTELSKLNPLQRLVYLGLNVLVIPVLVTSGSLYYFYNDWSLIGLGGLLLEPVALVHTAAAYIVMAFIIAHVYLSTTGRTPLSNIKAMLTGWEVVEEERLTKD